MKQKLITFVIIPSSSLQYQFRLWNRRNRFFVGNLGSVRYIDLHTSTIAHRSSATEREKDHPQGHRRYFADGGNLISSNVLLTKYAKNGRIDDARQLFDKMSERDVVSWTAMVTGYAQNGRIDDARHMFDRIPERNVVSWNAMVAGYAQNGRMKDAHTLFNRMPERNMVSWTVMIVGYARSGRIEEALKLFNQMPERNVVSWNAMVTGYAQNGRIEVARQLFDKMPERNVVSWTAMIAGYFDNGRTSEASQLFEQMTERSVVSWTAMIAGYTQNGLGKKAMEFFSHMQQAGMKPNPSTFTSVLNACVSLAVPEVGKQTHAQIIKIGFESDVFVGNALITMYAKFGSDDAQKMFCKMQQRDVISWNAMMAGYIQHGRVVDAYQMFIAMSERDVVSWTVMVAGYAQNGYIEEALKFFVQMKRAGMKPNRATFASILSACASLAALEQGKQIHANIIKVEYKSDVFVENALITMYSKCGRVDIAYHVFDKMPERDVVSWSAMIAGYAQHGSAKEALLLFDQMQCTGTKPNHITFVGVLTACSHSCLVDEGWHYYHSMICDHHITPGVDHYACIVDLLGRSGILNEAEDFIKRMPLQPDPVVWKALLGACRVHANTEVGERVAEHLFKLEPQNPAAYVLLSNIYAAVGRWDDVTKVRLMMKRRGVQKKAGSSWIEIKNKVYSFIVGDRSHPQTKKIYALLDKLNGQMREAGYVPDMNFALHDVEEEEKQHILYHHSEKLAIAFGIISTSIGTPIQIIKNLRVCGDCHTATKFISRIVGREIVVRDANRFHHFHDGICSCGDYW
eukprot:Gb_00867 [translate_table: standard]